MFYRSLFLYLCKQGSIVFLTTLSISFFAQYYCRMQLLLVFPAIPAICPQSEIVRRFYKIHLIARNTDYTKENILAKKRWLSNTLFAALMAERARSAKSTNVPYINGDPFTDTQEHPKSFSVASSECKKTEATVKVVFPDRPDKRWVVLLLVLQNNDWKIDDVMYEDGSRLSANLLR